MSRITLYLIAFVLALTNNVFAENSRDVNYSKIPSWVDLKEDVPREKGSKESGLSVRYIRSDQQFNITNEQYIYFNYLKMQPTNENGLEQVAEINISFNPNFETLSIHNIKIVRDGKTLNRLQKDKIKILDEDSSLENRQLNGRRKVVAVLEDIRVNDILFYSYSISGMNSVLGEKRFGRFSTSWRAPVENVNLRLITDKNNYIQISKTDSDPRIVNNADYDEYLWSFRDTPETIEEDRQPSWFTPYTFIEFSEYKNWQEVNDWAIELYSKYELSPEILMKVTQWKNSSSDKQKQLSLALQFVQDEIRYFGLEIGQNTHKPFTPAEVFERRYGDCKDKSVLLIGIFNELGFKSSPALVSSYAGRKLNDYLPSPGAFDHVIVNLPTDNGNLWLDATMSHQRGGLLNIGYIDYANALVVKKGTKSLTPFIRPKDKRSALSTKEHYKITDFKSKNTLSVETIYKGLKADTLRRNLAANGKTILAENYFNFYSRTYSGIEEDGEITVTDDENNNIISVVSKYLINDWTDVSAGKRILPLYASDINEYLSLPRSINRKYPLSVISDIDLFYEQSIELPDSSILNIPEQLVEKSTSYFDYIRKTDHKENKVTISHKFSPKSSFVLAENSQDYFAQIKEVRKELAANIIVVDKNGGDLKKQDSRLRNMAKRLMRKNND